MVHQERCPERRRGLEGVQSSPERVLYVVLVSTVDAGRRTPCMALLAVTYPVRVLLGAPFFIANYLASAWLDHLAGVRAVELLFDAMVRSGHARCARIPNRYRFCSGVPAAASGRGQLHASLHAEFRSAGCWLVIANARCGHGLPVCGYAVFRRVRPDEVGHLGFRMVCPERGSDNAFSLSDR